MATSTIVAQQKVGRLLRCTMCVLSCKFPQLALSFRCWQQGITSEKLSQCE
jgi:hypothetical protein